MRLPTLYHLTHKNRALRLWSEKEGFRAIWEGSRVGWREAGVGRESDYCRGSSSSYEYESYYCKGYSGSSYIGRHPHSH